MCNGNHFSLRSLIVFLVVFLSACRSADDGQSVATDSPSVPAISVDTDLIQPSGEMSLMFDGRYVTLNDPVFDHSYPVELINTDAESSNNTTEQSGIDGFAATEQCTTNDSQLVASSGLAYFSLLYGCNLTQRADENHSLDSAWSLTFDVAAPSGATLSSLIAEIVVFEEDGSTSALHRRVIDLDVSTSDWRTQQLVSGFNWQGAHAGKPVGVRFSNGTENGHVLLDNIELVRHQKSSTSNNGFIDDFNWTCDQLWAGEHYWANRLQDWQVSNGRVETRKADASRPMRTTHRISSALNSSPENFTLMVDTGPVSTAGVGSFSGFLVGAGGGMDYRSSALIHNRHGLHGGLLIAIDHQGRVMVHDNGLPNLRLAQGAISDASSSTGATLQLDAVFNSSGRYTLNVYARSVEGNLLSSTTIDVEPEQLLGNIALVSTAGGESTHHWFDNWIGAGGKLDEFPNRQLGPVLFSSYTLSREVLTVNSQYPVTCADAFHNPVLEVMTDGQWQEIATSSIDPAAYTAKFIVENWTETENTRYRIRTESKALESAREYVFDGVITSDPINDDELTIGVLNCRPGLIHRPDEGWIQNNTLQPFTWTRDRIVFPHEELYSNAHLQGPDLFAFLGDQLYEFDPNGLIERDPDELIHDYLWKWFQFGWSARESMRNTPSFILPDDHDVYQGNVWGQGGRAAEVAEDGGFVYPAEFVNVVQRTQTGSLPQPYDGTPVEQGITVHYTDIVFGGVGMAVVEDRKFKTGAHSAQTPRQLLGSRQLEFLDAWAADWRGQEMKLAFSQSPFAQSATHSGQNFNRNLGDRDANGWPKEGRDRAVHQLRKAFAPHIAGDQHLGMSLRHGIVNADDAIFSFAGPSMLNIFPRVWDPNNLDDGRGTEGDDYRGTHTDAHGNLISVLAAANPRTYYQSYDQSKILSKNDLGIGYGIVRVRKPQREFVFEAWPANQNPIATQASPYPGWPITIAQASNDGRVPVAYLESRVAQIGDPVVAVFRESNGELVYARRYPDSQIVLPVYDSEETYRVEISDGRDGYQESFSGQLPQ